MPVLRANFKIHISFWFDKMTWIWHLKMCTWGCVPGCCLLTKLTKIVFKGLL